MTVLSIHTAPSPVRCAVAFFSIAASLSASVNCFSDVPAGQKGICELTRLSRPFTLEVVCLLACCSKLPLAAGGVSCFKPAWARGGAVGRESTTGGLVCGTTSPSSLSRSASDSLSNLQPNNKSIRNVEPSGRLGS